MSTNAAVISATGASRASVGRSSAHCTATMPQATRNSLEHVHARFGGVADRVRIGGRHDHDDPREPGATEPPAREPQPDQRAHTEQRRQRAGRLVARAEGAGPDVEQRVVERRRAVAFERRTQVAERQPGDVHRQGFVEPHLRARVREQAEPGRDRKSGRDRDRGARARLAVWHRVARRRVGKQSHERREYRRRPRSWW